MVYIDSDCSWGKGKRAKHADLLDRNSNLRSTIGNFCSSLERYHPMSIPASAAALRSHLLGSFFPAFQLALPPSSLFLLCSYLDPIYIFIVIILEKMSSFTDLDVEGHGTSQINPQALSALYTWRNLRAKLSKLAATLFHDNSGLTDLKSLATREGTLLSMIIQ